MLRAYCSEWEGNEEIPKLSKDELHHLIRVRRVRAGETIEILNGRGDILICEVKETGAKDLKMDILKLARNPLPALRLHLLVALPKGKIFPALLQKSVELGVSEITPLITDNSEVPPSRANKKSDRWESLMVESVKQSGNPWMPVIHKVSSLTESLGKTMDYPLSLCAALQPEAEPVLKTLGRANISDGLISIYVGPEGDFSAREYAQMRHSGCRFVTLGERVLKVETAASLMVGSIRLWAQSH